MEQWKTIKNYPIYEVSDNGKVRNAKTKRTLKPQTANHGYLQVGLWSGNKRSYKYVHRLVADAFVANTVHGQEVNHINGEKADNRASNLEWVTRSENVSHAFRKLGRKPSIGLPPKKVMCIETGAIYASLHDASRQTGFTARAISAVCNGKRYTHKGKHWRFV